MFQLQLNFLYCPHYIMCHCSNLYHVCNNNFFFVILVTQLFAKSLQLFCSQATSHKADWILTDYCPLCLAVLYMHNFSLQKVLKVEGSRSRLLENSIATACICTFSYLSVPFFFMLVVVGLFGMCSMYLLVCICVLRTHCLLLRSLSLRLRFLSLSYSWSLFL